MRGVLALADLVTGPLDIALRMIVSKKYGGTHFLIKLKQVMF